MQPYIQFLQPWSKYKPLQWIDTLKPYLMHMQGHIRMTVASGLDSYCLPVTLFITFSANVLKDPAVNLLAITVNVCVAWLLLYTCSSCRRKVQNWATKCNCMLWICACSCISAATLLTHYSHTGTRLPSLYIHLSFHCLHSSAYHSYVYVYTPLQSFGLHWKPS